MGRFFDVWFVASGRKIYVYRNGILTHTFSFSGWGLSFKASAYTQSNPTKGDDPTSIGRIEINALTVSHAT